MSNIPTQKENPNGLHGRYHIQKVIAKSGAEIVRESKNRNIHISTVHEYKFVPVDEDAEYFVMRLDTGGSDLKHIEACRIGIHAYADAIYPHLPELAIDLKNRYPLL